MTRVPEKSYNTIQSEGHEERVQLLTILENELWSMGIGDDLCNDALNSSSSGILEGHEHILADELVSHGR